MKIAELFVQLGVKGDDKSKRAITGISDGLADVKSMSLGAKAAMVGAIYGLERMMSQSMRAGAGLKQFGDFTGLSTKRLQQWQYAAKMASVSNEEVEGSFKSVQSAMTNMLMGKGAPEGLDVLANMVGFDTDKSRDTFYVMEKLTEFARKAPKDIGNKILQSFGISEGMIVAMRRNAFTAKALTNAPIYSKGEISKLEKVNAGWAKIGHQMKLTMGKLSAKHGMPVVEDIGKVAVEISKLIESIVILAGNLQVFKAIGMIITGWSDAIKLTTQQFKFWTSDDSISQKASSYIDTAKDVAGWMGELVGINTEKDPLKGLARPTVASSLKYQAREKQGNNQNTVNQTLNFQHDGSNASETSSSVKKAVTDAYLQMNLTQEF